MKIVFMGDSLTYAYGIVRPKVWTSIISDETGIECINKGINGDTTAGMLSRFREDVIAEQPDFVHIMGGGNDLICEADLGVLKSNLMAMVNHARANKITPIIASVVRVDTSYISEKWLGLPNYDKIQEMTDEYSAWLRDFAKFSKLKFIDYRTLMPEYMVEDISEYYLDGLHLSEKGNILLAKMFMEQFDKL